MAELLLFSSFVTASFVVTHWNDLSRAIKWRMAAFKAGKSNEKSELNDAT